jgi:hypothetical protein
MLGKSKDERGSPKSFRVSRSNHLKHPLFDLNQSKLNDSIWTSLILKNVKIQARYIHFVKGHMLGNAI